MSPIGMARRVRLQRLEIAPATCRRSREGGPAQVPFPPQAGWAFSKLGPCRREERKSATTMAPARDVRAFEGDTQIVGPLAIGGVPENGGPGRPPGRSPPCRTCVVTTLRSGCWRRRDPLSRLCEEAVEPVPTSAGNRRRRPARNVGVCALPSQPTPTPGPLRIPGTTGPRSKHHSWNRSHPTVQGHTSTP